MYQNINVTVQAQPTIAAHTAVQAPTVQATPQATPISTATQTNAPLGLSAIERGPKGDPGTNGTIGVTFTQVTPSASWLIAHNLGRRPSVTVYDSAGSRVYGTETVLDINTIEIDFSAGFSGTAYLI